MITITSNEPWNTETQKTGRNPLITNHKPWPLEPVDEKFFFLKGPLKWLTAAKNANAVGFWTSVFVFLWKVQWQISVLTDLYLFLTDFAARIDYCKVDGGSSVVHEPNGVNLRCKADGYPLATIRWFHNGTEIPVCKNTTSSTGCVGERYQVKEDRNRKFAFVESSLMIKNTKYPRDHGNYTCVANNSELQNATKHVEISVYCMSCRNLALIVIFRVQT